MTRDGPCTRSHVLRTRFARIGPLAPPSSAKTPGRSVGVRPGRAGAVPCGWRALRRIAAEMAALEPTIEYQLRAQLKSTLGSTAGPRAGVRVAMSCQLAVTQGRREEWIEHGGGVPAAPGV